MEKKNRGKLKIVLITCAVLAVCASALFAGIAIAGNIEENKIIKTAYTDTGVKKADTATVKEALTKAENFSASSLEAQENLSLDNTDQQSTHIEENTEKEVDETSETANQASEEASNDTTETQDESQPQKLISEDEAKEIMVDFLSRVFNIDVTKSSLSASLKTTHMGVKREYWFVKHEDYDCSINALSSEIITLWGIYNYEGTDSEGSYNFSNRKSDESYYKKAENIVNKHLASGREIELVYIDGVQVVFSDDGESQTLLVDCHVLMKSGPSYTLSFIGSEQQLYWYSSHPTKKACVWGYYWEDDGGEYPDFIPYKEGDTIIYNPSQASGGN